MLYGGLHLWCIILGHLLNLQFISNTVAKFLF